METKFNLESIVKTIESKAGSKAILDSKFELEYLIPNITEEMLLELGFAFKEKSSYHVCPIYQKGNIIALFDETVLHVSETIC